MFAGSHVDPRTGQTVNNFLNSYTLIQTATDASFFAIMAVGATIVIISGGIDLSVGSIYALAGVTTAMVLRAPAPSRRWRPSLLGLAVSLGIGLACGAINGALVVGLGVHPFIITLGTMWIVRGIAFVASSAESILLPHALTRVAKASLGLGDALYPVPMLVMLAVAVIGEHVPDADRRGRHVFAVGGNVEASRFSGVPHRTREGAGVRPLGPDGGDCRVHGRELLRIGVVRRRDRLRAVRDCVGRRRRGQPVRRQGQRRQRAARRAPDRADSPVDPDAAFRPELRMDHHRLRDHHRRRARPGERDV